MGIYFLASPPACCCGAGCATPGPAAGAAGRPVHGTGGHPVRRLGARIRGAAGRALRPGAGAGHLLHHHADHAARPPAGRGADPLLHHAGRRAVLVAGAGAAGGPAAGGPGGFRGVLGGIAALAGLLLAAGWAQVGETRTAPAARQPMLRLARRMLRDPELLCTAMLVAGLNLLAFVLCCRPLHDRGRCRGWGSAGSAWPWRWPAPSARYGTGACRPSQGPARRGGAGPVLRGGRRGGAGIGDLARAHARPLVGRGRAPIFAGYGMAIPNLLGPALRRYGDCLAGPARCSAWAITACWGCCWRRRRGCSFGSPVPLALAWAGVTLALAGLHRLRGRLT